MLRDFAAFEFGEYVSRCAPTTLMDMLTPESATECGERQGQTMEEFLDARWAF